MAGSRVVLITGANSGLGYETAHALYSSTSTWSTIIVCARSLQKAQVAVSSLRATSPSSCNVLTALQLDVTDDESIERARDYVTTTHGRLDVLLNHAASSFDADFVLGGKTLQEAWSSAWNVNVSGTVCLTWSLVPLLLASNDARLVFMTSGASPLAEKLASPLRGPALLKRSSGMGKTSKTDKSLLFSSYRSTKADLNMMLQEFASMLKDDGIKVWAITPSFLTTGLGSSSVAIKRAMGAAGASVEGQFVRGVVDGLQDHQAGTALRHDPTQPW